MGNPLPTQQLIDSVKAAGFKTIRIPTAWDGNANQTTYEISPNWISQVKQVVDYCIKDSLFVILNIHWDGGWLENMIDSCVTNTAMRQKIAAKQGRLLAADRHSLCVEDCFRQINHGIRHRYDEVLAHPIFQRYDQIVFTLHLISEYHL